MVLTGAGISKESGLETFRDANGIWAQVRWEDIATPEAFHRDPQRVHGLLTRCHSSVSMSCLSKRSCLSSVRTLK